MQRFMATFHCGENLIPLAFDVSAVGVKVSSEPRFGEDPFACRNLLGNRDPDTERDDAHICDDVHIGIVARCDAALM